MSKSEDIGQDPSRTTTEIEETCLTFMQHSPPLFISGVMLSGDAELVMLVVGDQPQRCGAFVPKGHLVMTLGAFSRLLEAGAAHMEKVAAGRIGAPMGRA